MFLMHIKTTFIGVNGYTQYPYAVIFLTTPVGTKTLTYIYIMRVESWSFDDVVGAKHKVQIASTGA